MTSISERARAAQRLLDDPELTDFLNEIEAEATQSFLDSGGDPDRMAVAHERVRAVETLRQHLANQVSDQAVAAKRSQHRD